MMRYLLALVLPLFTACTVQQQPWRSPTSSTQLQYHRAQPAVSSSSNWEQAYVSAFNAAQQEWQLQTSPPQTLSPNHNWLNIKALWGQPPTSVAAGETLLPLELRNRLNDAIATTPDGQQASWHALGHAFVFLPNSPVYRAQVSGGRCRDGIVIIHLQSQAAGAAGQAISQRRGLFCQAGPAADWLLQNFANNA